MAIHLTTEAFVIMADDLKAAKKLTDALKLENCQLRHKIKNLYYLERIVQPKLEQIRTEIADKFRCMSSGQPVVLNEKDGKFSDPIIVNTTDVEEALCPEDVSYERSVCLPIPHINDFKEF